MFHTTELADEEVNYFFNKERRIKETTMVKLREEVINRPKDLVSFNADYESRIAEA